MDNHAATIYPFLQRGGELGELTRTYNWAKTELGTPDTWPQSLCTTLSIILNSRFPMFLFWGPQYICFYNDAYRPSLGDNGKHPEALGRPGAQVWPDIWPVIKPLLDQVMGGGEATYDEDRLLPIFRNGKMEEVYWTASYSPVVDETGTINGVFTTCFESTAKVINTALLQQSNQRLNNLFRQINAGIAQLNTAGRFIEVNDRYCQMLGYSREVLLQMNFVDVNYSADKVCSQQLFERWVEQGNGFLTTQRYRCQDGSAIWVNNSVSLVTEADGRQLLTTVSIDITKEKEQEQQLIASEARFRSLIEEAPIATSLFIGKDLTIALANERMLNLWDKPDSVIGQSLIEAGLKLNGPPFGAILADVYTTGKVYSESAVPTKLLVNGTRSTYYFNYTYKPLFDATGQVYGILTMAVDITQQVLAQQRIEESERQLLTSFEEAPVGIALMSGEDLIFEMVNPFYANLTGRPLQALIGKELLVAMPELVGQSFDQLLRNVIKTGESYTAHEAPVHLKRGEQLETIYIDHTYQPRRSKDGSIIGVLVVVIDVTQQVRIRKVIEESEATLRNAIELAQLGTWKMDVVTGQMTYSERLQGWLGVNDAVLGREASPRVHPKDRDRISQAIEKALAEGGTGRYEETYTITNAITGEEHIIHASGQTVFDPEGNPLILSGTAQDVTLQQQMQLMLEQQVQQRTQELALANNKLMSANEELLESSNRLLRSNESLQQFAFVASHDLQEPLRKIQAFGDLLKQQYVSSLGEGADLLNRMQLAANRMSGLIRDLLSYSRLSTRQDPFDRVVLDDILQDVLVDLELVVRDTAATITYSPLPTTLGDATQLSQLLFNLLSNALKFRRQRADGTSLAPVIDITCHYLAANELPADVKPVRFAPSYYQIAVSDNGIGFEPKYATRIFGVFQRLHGKNEYAGTGVGLGICERVVTNHGGAIVAEGRPGQGATFWVYLPV